MVNNIIRIIIILFFYYPIFTQSRNIGIVSSATPEATKAGVSILKKGGNAVDAAVAVSFALGVTEPAMSGIGGRTMLLLSIPNREPIAIGGVSLTPSFVEKNIPKDKLTYYKQISIPSQVKIMYYTWKKYGSGKIKWKDLLAPAIELAENGFKVGVHRHHVFKRCQKKLLSSPYHNRELMINGDIPAIGDIVKQPSLAKTLSRIANYGANDFYSGQIAKDIADDIKNNGGWIKYDDLKKFPEPKEYKAISTKYRGYDIYSFSAPSGGWQVLQSLNMLENIEPKQINTPNQNREKILVKIINKVHTDRFINPITNYYNKEHINYRISKYYAKKLLNKKIDVNIKDSVSVEKKDEGETTHFSIIDKGGMAISVTSSIGAYFGSYTSTKELGFFYNSYLRTFKTFGVDKPLSPNKLIPSSMSPCIVKKDGKNVLIIGTPGSKRIVSTIAQLIQLWIDGTISIKEIIKLPRIHSQKNTVYIENQNINLINSLRLEGYKIGFPAYDLTTGYLNAYFGGVHAIEFKNNNWNAAADPRRDGLSMKTIK